MKVIKTNASKASVLINDEKYCIIINYTVLLYVFNNNRQFVISFLTIDYIILF